MPKSYLSRLDIPKVRSTRRYKDDEMTPSNMRHYLEAKKDLENGVNIVSAEQFISRFNLK